MRFPKFRLDQQQIQNDFQQRIKPAVQRIRPSMQNGFNDLMTRFRSQQESQQTSPIPEQNTQQLQQQSPEQNTQQLQQQSPEQEVQLNQQAEQQIQPDPIQRPKSPQQSSLEALSASPQITGAISKYPSKNPNQGGKRPDGYAAYSTRPAIQRPNTQPNSQPNKFPLMLRDAGQKAMGKLGNVFNKATQNNPQQPKNGFMGLRNIFKKPQ